jgi:hypothetical protein
MTLTEFHGRLSNAVLIYVVILGVWGFYSYLRRRGISEGYWGALVIGEILILAQGVVGAVLWYQGLRPDRGLHVLYGIVTALGIPAVYVYTRGREGRAENLAYGSMALIVALLAYRAVVTA